MKRGGMQRKSIFDIRYLIDRSNAFTMSPHFRISSLNILSASACDPVIASKPRLPSLVLISSLVMTWLIVALRVSRMRGLVLLGAKKLTQDAAVKSGKHCSA